MEKHDLHFMNFERLILSNENFIFDNDITVAGEKVKPTKILKQLSEIQSKIEKNEKLTTKEDIKLIMLMKTILTQHYQLRSTLSDFVLETTQLNDSFDQLILDLHVMIKNHTS